MIMLLCNKSRLLERLRLQVYKYFTFDLFLFQFYFPDFFNRKNRFYNKPIETLIPMKFVNLFFDCLFHRQIANKKLIFLSRLLPGS